MLTKFTWINRIALLGILCWLALAGLVACSTNEEPVPAPKKTIRFSAVDSQGLVPVYMLVAVADSTQGTDLNTDLGLIPEDGTLITRDLADFLNRPSYYLNVTLSWDKVKKGSNNIQAKPTSRIKAEFFVDNQLQRTIVLTPTNGSYGMGQACIYCNLDQTWIIADGFTVKK
jgi:hypothetical protein